MASCEMRGMQYYAENLGIAAKSLTQTLVRFRVWHEFDAAEAYERAKPSQATF